MILPFMRNKKSMESESFKILIETHKEELFRIAYSIVRNEDKAKDVVQETFIIAWKNLSQLRDKSKFSSWIKTIAANKAKDYYKKSKMELLIIDNDNAPPVVSEEVYLDLPEYILEQKEFKQRLLEEINKLNSQYSEVLYLYYFANLSYDEIAYHLATNRSTIGSRLHRGKLLLKKRLEESNFLGKDVKEGVKTHE